MVVNGTARSLEVEEEMPLLWATKFGCGAGIRGACTVLLDGEAVRSGITPAIGGHGDAIRAEFEAVTAAGNERKQP